MYQHVSHVCVGGDVLELAISMLSIMTCSQRIDLVLQQLAGSGIIWREDAHTSPCSTCTCHVCETVMFADCIHYTSTNQHYSAGICYQYNVHHQNNTHKTTH